MSEDATFGSYVALQAQRPGTPRGRRPGKRALAGAGLITGAAALLAGGAVLGASFTGADGRASAYNGRSPATATATYPAPPADPGLPRRRCPAGRAPGLNSRWASPTATATPCSSCTAAASSR